MRASSNQDAFLALVRAGLWDTDARLSLYETLNFSSIMKIAEEQSVMGLVTAGLDRVKEVKIPQQWMLQFIGSTLQIEQRNNEMNSFVAQLLGKLQTAGVYCLLVKGQGIAQCYEQPLWRSSGDVDLLVNGECYHTTRVILSKMADSAGKETVKNNARMHQEYQIEGWTVELHGTMHSNLSRKIDKGIDEVQNEVIYGGKVRLWTNDGALVYLPAADEDVIFVFTHILQHLFLEGIGLRQICDWCRLLYTYREKLDLRMLEQRIRKMGLMTEWKALYNLANKYLGMPDFGDGLMSHDSRYDKKSERLMEFVMEVGNFGHNREVDWSNGLKRRAMLIWHRITDTIKLSRVFPIDAPKFLLNYACDGVRGLVKG